MSSWILLVLDSILDPQLVIDGVTRTWIRPWLYDPIMHVFAADVFISLTLLKAWPLHAASVLRTNLHLNLFDTRSWRYVVCKLLLYAQYGNHCGGLVHYRFLCALQLPLKCPVFIENRSVSLTIRSGIECHARCDAGRDVHVLYVLD